MQITKERSRTCAVYWVYSSLYLRYSYIFLLLFTVLVVDRGREVPLTWNFRTHLSPSQIYHLLLYRSCINCMAITFTPFQCITKRTLVYLLFCMQMMSGSRSMVQHTRTTVLWPWRTLVKIILPCSAWLTSLLVADDLNLGLSQETGYSPIKLEFLVVAVTGTFIEPEVRWWYVWTVEEVERMGSTTVRYLPQWMLTRPSTLECTIQGLVRCK